MTAFARLALLRAVRQTIENLDVCGTRGAVSAIKPLLDLGVTAGCGRRYFADGQEHADETSEALTWYAGEIVDVIESKSWFAVNSLIGCVDRFAPRIADTRKEKKGA